MCNKPHHVKRFYTLIMTPIVSITSNPICIGVFKAPPSMQQVKVVFDSVKGADRNAFKVNIVPVDIPRSILF
jgi:hypothetical protein